LPEVLAEALADHARPAGLFLRAGLAARQWRQLRAAALGTPAIPSTTRQIASCAKARAAMPACPYCSLHLDPCKELERYFGYAAFRPEPKNPSGGSLQEDIVRAGYAGESLLAILPTGGGKSICYQLPALSRHWRNGSLTIIISPLQSLMKDQVDNLIKVGIYNSATLNGMLTMPERRDVLDKVRLGDIGILLVSPEQFATAPLSRPSARDRSAPGCSTKRIASPNGATIFAPTTSMSRASSANAMPQRRGNGAGQLLYRHRQARGRRRHPCPLPGIAGPELRILDGGHERENLHYEVMAVGKPEKNPLIHRLLEKEFGPARSAPQLGGAVVFAGKRGRPRRYPAFSRTWAGPAPTITPGSMPA
jgi:ATP-dependent DNA helicase RecQ